MNGLNYRPGGYRLNSNDHSIIYLEEIYNCLEAGYRKSKTVKYLFSLGYDGVKSTAFDYLVKIENLSGRYFAPQP